MAAKKECKINSKFHITRNSADEIITNIFTGEDETVKLGDPKYTYASKGISILLSTKNDYEKNVSLRRVFTIAGIPADQIESRLLGVDGANAVASDFDKKTNGEKIKKTFDKALATKAMNDLIRFFSEFSVTPSMRLVNTLGFKISGSTSNKDAIDYIASYFNLQDHSYKNEISEKVKSAEFERICNDLRDANVKPKKAINSRLVVYYGVPGSGKTTEAQKKTTKAIVCSSDMLPADIMQNFVFKDGKADFDPSDLWKAMENGESILLDEINMLPFETLRFIQGITDNKEEINYKGRTIKVHKDFKIYGTMNLDVNGQTIPLPEPLVDRAEDIVEFTLNAKDLLKALC